MTMTSSESEAHAQRSQKRARKSNRGEDGAAGGKRTRGRPRVDTQDATAADRRRTQIRLAQRAYRQRKETTIVSLKKQSAQLHSITEQMEKIFNQLAESTLTSGLLQLNPDLAQEFRHAKDTFSALAKAASETESLIDDEGDSGEGSAPQKPSEREPEPVLEHIGWGYSTVSPLPSKGQSQQDLPMSDGYSPHLGTMYDPSAPSITSRRLFTFGQRSHQHDGILPFIPDTSSPHTSSQQELPFGLVTLQDRQPAPYEVPDPYIYAANMQNSSATPLENVLPTPPLPASSLLVKTLAPIKTYSFEETTLGRRIARATAEFGFQVLTKFHYPIPLIDRAFKLNYPYYSYDQIRERFQLVLSKNIHEDLDWMESPFGHLGGAGTHYPRRDSAGNIIPKKKPQTPGWIGPRQKKLHGPEHPDDGTVECLHGVDVAGFEGEWFDPYDVQGYLEEQYACKMEPMSSFAECLIDIEGDKQGNPDAHVPRQALENGVAKHDAHSLDTSYNDMAASKGSDNFTKLVDHEISFDQTLGLDLAPGFDYGFGSMPGFGTELGLRGMGENLEGLHVIGQRKKRVWVDVPRLVQEIVRTAVCLGRTPGFRRKNVDRAVRMALVQEAC